jgi:hypothetical protein
MENQMCGQLDDSPIFIAIDICLSYLPVLRHLLNMDDP